MRIVSLLPSATEIVCLLGLRDRLVGVTHECDFPVSVVELPKVTHTFIPADAGSAQIDALVRQRAAGGRPLYQLDLPTLEALRPDLIVTQALCDVCAVDESEVRQAAWAMPWGPQVVNLAPMSLEDVFQSMHVVARAAGVADEGEAVIDGLRARVQAIAGRSRQIDHHPSVVFLEWIDPLCCGGHWNPQLVELAGGCEMIGKPNSPSRRIDWEQLRAADPQVLFIACCGFGIQRAMIDLPALRANPGWEQSRAVKGGRVYLTDGSSYFNRPGPRLVESLEILAHAIDPDLFPAPQTSKLRSIRSGNRAGKA
jgi:iron complex transport system substrate-binding protein